VAENLKTQLAKLYPSRAPLAKGHPPYCDLTIPQVFERFCKELAGTSITDPRGTIISIFEVNFPKLLGLKMAATGKKAKASNVLASLHDGSFDAAFYTFQRDRIRTLFWIPETLTACDAIHPNGHKTIQGSEAYIKRYKKDGAPIKIIFTEKLHSGHTIITTSFLVESKELARFIREPATWTSKK
jgi:hypothetical protein